MAQMGKGEGGVTDIPAVLHALGNVSAIGLAIAWWVERRRRLAAERRRRS